METILKGFFRGYSFAGTCRILLLLVAVLPQPAGAQTAAAQTAVVRSDSPAELPLSARVLHPRLREWPYPKDSVSLGKDELHFLWPGQKGKAVRYRVRIARDSLFRQPILLSDPQKWAVYTVRTPIAPGGWYWQYGWQNPEREEWNWSPAYSFRVSEPEKNKEISKSPGEILNAVKGTHPRLFGMDKNLALFKNNNSRNPEATAFVGEIQKLVGAPLPPEVPTRPRDTTGMTPVQREKMIEFMYHGFGEKVGRPVIDLSIAWLLTEDERFIKEAIRRAVHLAGLDPAGYSTRDDFNNANVMEAMAWAYDFGYHHLSGPEKELIRKAVTARARPLYEHMVNRFELHFCDNHIWQHLIRNFSVTAVALAGDVPEANEWLSYLYEVWTARFPVLGTADGGWFEGNGYFKVHFQTLIYLPVLWTSLTGTDYFSPAWMRHLPYYLIYSYPPGAPSTAFGDMHDELTGPSKMYAIFAEALSRKLPDPHLKAYVEKMKRYSPQFFTGKDPFVFFRLLTYEPAAPPSAGIQAPPLPRSRVFRDVGLAAMHSDLSDTENNVAVYMNANPFGASGHGHAAQNAITINKGNKKLFGGSGYYSNFSDAHTLLHYRSSRAYNTILADSLGQKIGEDGYAWIARHLPGTRIQYTLGDASQAYGDITTPFWLSHFKRNNIAPDRAAGYGDAGVKRFRRHTLLLDDRYVVIYDELEAAQPVKWTSQFHSPYPLQARNASQENVFELTEEGATLAIGRVFSAFPCHVTAHDRFASPAINWKGRTGDESGTVRDYALQWHVGVTTTDRTPACYFLTVLDLRPTGTQPSAVQTTSSFSLVLDGWKLEANLRPDQPASLFIKSSDNKTTFHYGSDDPHRLHTVAGSSVLSETQPDGSVSRQEAVDEWPEVVKTDTEFPIKKKCIP